MKKSSHKAVGVGGLIGILVAGGDVLSAVAFYLGSSFPDVDTKWNEWNKFRKDFLGHRGITHSLFLNLFFATVSYGFSLFYPFLLPIFFFFLGSLIHVLLDMFSPLGVPLYLSYNPRVKLPLYKTGTLRDEFFAYTFAAFLVGMGYYYKIHAVEFTELQNVLKILLSQVFLKGITKVLS